MVSESDKVDPMSFVSLNIKSLKLFKMWFFTSEAKSSFKFHADLICGITFVSLFLVLPPLAELFYLIKLMESNFSLQETAGIVNLVLIEIQTVFKMADLFFHREQLRELLSQLTSKRFEGRRLQHQVILKRYVTMARSMFICLLFTCTLDIFVHIIIVPIIDGFTSLPMKMDFLIFDANTTPYFESVFMFQILYKPGMIAAFVSIESFAWVIMASAIAQLDILIWDIKYIEKFQRLLKINNKDANQNTTAYFKEIILHHKAIIRYVTKIQSTFSGQIGITFLLTAVIMCNTTLEIFSVETPSKHITTLIWILMYWANILTTLFVSCWLGNLLTIKSLQIATAAYFSPWIGLSQSYKKSLLLLLIRSQRPIVIRAAKFIPVSLTTFTTIIEWTYKGFAALNQMKK